MNGSSSKISMLNNVDPYDLEKQIRQMTLGCDDSDDADDHNDVMPPPNISNLSSNDANDPSGSSKWNEYLEGWRMPRSSFVAEQARKADIPLACRICRRYGNRITTYVLCGGCGPAHEPAHRSCLAQFDGHRPQAQRVGLFNFREPCKEVDFDDFIYTAWLLDSRFIDSEKEFLHIDDCWSTWFGVPHYQDGPFPQFYIYPRLQNLISTGRHGRPDRQFPSLISFVGDTGSGKSTLIRAMIRMLAPRAHKSYRAPVPGSPTDGFDSTSSDVHLFADPATLREEDPMLFVDCEGFSGTDTPVARKILSEASQSNTAYHFDRQPSKRTGRDLLSDHQCTTLHRIDLEWGKVLVPVTPPVEGPSSRRSRRSAGHVDIDSRKIVVRTLYPRLLYAFSDVVCFVTTNARAAQTILEEMFSWAKDGHEKTLNQQVRPGLIIILNKVGQDSIQTMSSVKKATEGLLTSFQKSTRFTELQMNWKNRGINIISAEDLILRYYGSFRVIPISQHTGSPTTAGLVSGQIKGLYGEIRSMATWIHNKKKRLNFDFGDLDVSNLSASFVECVSVLARDYKNTLDLYRLSVKDSTLPHHFYEKPAKCPVAHVSEAAQKQTEFLVEEARRGLQAFRDRYWRCEAKDSRGRRRCKNYSRSHNKGHQFDYRDDRSRDSRRSSISDLTDLFSHDLESGQYQSSYDPETYQQLWDEIGKIRGQDSDLIVETLARAASLSGVYKIKKQRTCLACLSNAPTNMLPCKENQHGICEDCIRRYAGSKRHQSIVKLNRCPLGCHLAQTPWSIRVKPKTAGPRVLALDGGGIRGIIQLAILLEIERAIGLQIPIQEFFDLVIGTGSGSIVALGVFVKGWTIDGAIERFASFSEDAFSLRTALSVPVFSKLAEPFCDYRYKDVDLKAAVIGSFREEGYMFGQSKGQARKRHGDRAKVGVVTSQEGRHGPCLIANYSRNPVSRPQNGPGARTRGAYDWLQREDEQAKDFRIWQAARAAWSTPTLFQPYQHRRNLKTYMDGSSMIKNPISLAYDEVKRIWPSDPGSSIPPDIMLSIGTGIQVDDEGYPKDSRSDRFKKMKDKLSIRVRQAVDTGLDTVGATLACHEEWVSFQSNVRGRLELNCHRLNIGLPRQPPKLDAVSDVNKLLRYSRDYIWQDSHDSENRPHLSFPPYRLDSRYTTVSQHITAVARRLLASVFYLEDFLPVRMLGGEHQNVIHCRLPPSEGTLALLALRPRFQVREVPAPGSGGEDCTNEMRFVNGTEDRDFDHETLSAHVRFRVSEGPYRRFVEMKFRRRRTRWEPIGGF
ncbi:hypothetical protein QBC44DRAFT_403535 [Cladorrhinum sp. PSN332]|nr:hypothetical protein QBC44DRAFT_403535 [Cladorrhinum sp. PSN332]